MTSRVSTPAIERIATSQHPLGMSAEEFLTTYWQKRPVLIRGAFNNFQSPISPDELAGLACEDGALSRLIIHDASNDSWQVQTGPLPEDAFENLPERDWTLLVQDVDKWDVDVASLLSHFQFLPRWRIDDIMVSYAAPEGSVGAHVDQYDVFLIQGLGHRHWQIDASDNPPQGFRDDVELKLLSKFTPSHDWVLGPGDMLYLPPGVPHHGVAQDECLTISVGMRAPSHGELLADLADTLAERLPDAARYADPDLMTEASDGRIDAATVSRVRAALTSIQTIDDAELANWFAGFITQYRSAGQIIQPPRAPSAATVRKKLATGASLHLHPLARCAWIDSEPNASLYIDGERYCCGATLASHLSQRHPVNANLFAACDSEDQDLLLALNQRGILALSND